MQALPWEEQEMRVEYATVSEGESASIYADVEPKTRRGARPHLVVRFEGGAWHVHSNQPHAIYLGRHDDEGSLQFALESGTARKGEP